MRSTSDIVLYDSPPSPCARRVRISLLEKGIDWRTQNIDLSRLEQRSKRFLDVNPNGWVPALAHGSQVLWESNVITEYLDRVFPDKLLYPAKADQRVDVKTWQVAELAMAKYFRPLMYQRLMGPIVHSSRSYDEAMAIVRRSTDSPADLEWEDKVWRLAVLTPAEQAIAQRQLYAFADQVEASLQANGWLVGDGFSQAEISVYPRLLMYSWIGVPLPPDRYPKTLAWMARLADRPSFLKSQPEEITKLVGFLQSPLCSFLRKATSKPVDQRSIIDRIGISLIGKLLKRAMGKGASGVADWIRPSGPAPSTTNAAPRPVASLDAGNHIRLCRPKVSPDGDLITLALRTRKLAFDVAEDTGDVRLELAGKTVSDPLLALDVIDLASATGPRLFPEDPVAETEVRIWLAFGASWHKEFNPLMEIRIRGHDNVRTDLSLDSAVKVLEGRLNQIEEHLKTRTWIAGEAFSLADAALYGKTSLLPKLGVQTADSRPRLAAWMKRVADATAS